MAMAPASVITMAMTMANLGLSMKMPENMIYFAGARVAVTV
jgi:hypothetical protein